MGEADGNEMGCRHDIGGLHDQPHGELHGFAMVSGKQLAFVPVESNGHALAFSSAIRLRVT